MNDSEVKLITIILVMTFHLIVTFGFFSIIFAVILKCSTKKQIN